MRYYIKAKRGTTDATAEIVQDSEVRILAAINLSEAIVTALASGPVEFAYRKKSGEFRIAKGTTNLSYIPEENHPQGYERNIKRPDNKPYWDLNSEGWRAFNLNQVVWVNDIGHDNLTKDEYNQIMKHLVNR